MVHRYSVSYEFSTRCNITVVPAVIKSGEPELLKAWTLGYNHKVVRAARCNSMLQLGDLLVIKWNLLLGCRCTLVSIPDSLINCQMRLSRRYYWKFLSTGHLTVVKDALLPLSSA